RRPALSRPRSAACRADRWHRICQPPFRQADRVRGGTQACRCGSRAAGRWRGRQAPEQRAIRPPAPAPRPHPGPGEPAFNQLVRGAPRFLEKRIALLGLSLPVIAVAAYALNLRLSYNWSPLLKPALASPLLGREATTEVLNAHYLVGTDQAA